MSTRKFGVGLGINLDAERRCRQTKTRCQVDRILPDDVKKKALEQSRELECIAPKAPNRAKR